jgi:DNA-binding NtrC family response regulator
MQRLTTTYADGAAMGPELGIKIAAVKDLAFELLTQLDGMKQPPSMNLKDGINIRDELLRYEIELIRMALRVTSNHQRRAATILGVNATTLNSKIKRYNIKLMNS